MEGKLETLVREYKKDEPVLGELLDQAYLTTYQWAGCNKLIGEEGAADFLLSVRPKIPKYIDKFCVEKGAFKPYLSVCLKRHAQDYYRKKSWKEEKERAYTYHFPMRRIKDSLQDLKPSYGDSFYLWLEKIKDKLSTIKNPRTIECLQKRFLCLFLYYAYYISLEHMEEISALCGVGPSEFYRYRIFLVDGLKGRLEKINVINQKINHHFLELQVSENKKSIAVEKNLTEHYQRLVDHYKVRLRYNQRRANNLNLLCSQNEISKLLKIPAGTVSSCIYYAKKFLSPLSMEFLSG